MNRKIVFGIFSLIAALQVSGFGQNGSLGDGQKAVVCGDHLVMIVDLSKSSPDTPAIVWEWNAYEAMDLPEEFRTKKFNSIDDCKVFGHQKKMMVSSSSGAVAILRIRDKKVLFHTEVPNAHSIEIMPGNRLAAAASTHARGNKLMVFDIKSGEFVFQDSLYSAHGVVWDHERDGLFALGYGVLRFYSDGEDGQMNLEQEWTIPGESGHDLTRTPDGNYLLMTEHTGAWKFDIDAEKFSKIDSFPEAENIKSLGLHSNGQYIYTVPEKSWWTYHVSFFNPALKLAFPGIKVYKARWFTH